MKEIIKLNKTYSLDLGGLSLVDLKVVEILRDGVDMEYVNSPTKRITNFSFDDLENHYGLYRMNSLDKQYIDLLQDILENGVVKGDRTGTGTISVFGRQIRHKMSDGFPLLTTKQMPFKSIVTELIWFLRGDTNIKYLVDNKCNIWNGDAYKNYQGKQLKSFPAEPNSTLSLNEFIEKIKTDDKFAEKWGELGPIYGSQWRNWKGFRHGWHDVAKTIDGIEPHIDWLKGIDQISNLIYDLKNNPDSRRLMVNAWNVAEIDKMVLPPCHYGFQMYTRELTWQERRDLLKPEHADYIDENGVNHGFGYISPFTEPIIHLWLDNHNIPRRAVSLMWNQRSVDTFLGLPFNIASYGLLLQIIAEEVNMVPDELIGILGDTHLYSNHLDAAKEQITRIGFELPRVRINTEFWNPENVLGDDFVNVIPSIERDDFELENYKHDAKIEAPLSN